MLRKKILQKYLIITILLICIYYTTLKFFAQLSDLVILATILVSLYYISPAYISNGLAVIFGKNGHPIDFKKNFFDNYRILGDGKTYEGLVGGVISGFLLGFSLNYFVNQTIIPLIIIEPEVYDMLVTYGFFQILMNISLISIFFISLGALIGDMVGSFIKRRLKFSRGAPVLFLDQLDFVLGALFFGAFFISVNWLCFISVILLTPIIHFIANIIANLLKLKKEPW